MPGPIEAAGAVKTPTRYGALTMGARQMTGIWTQRSPYRDADTPYLTAKFYSGSRFDSIIDGLNREISVRLTDIRSPGSEVFNNNAFPRINSFYSWQYLFDGALQVKTIVDGADGNIYDATPPGKSTLMTKAAGSGRAAFLGLSSGVMYIGDGVDKKKILRPSTIWKANTSYPVGSLIIDSNGNLQKVQANPVSLGVTQVQVGPFGPGGVWQVTVITLSGPAPTIPDNQTVSFSGLTNYTSLNGQTLMWKAMPPALLQALNLSANQIAFVRPVFFPNYGPAADTGTAVIMTGNDGTSGGSQPAWATGIGQVTIDNGVAWTNFGSPVQNWGIEPPADYNDSPYYADLTPGATLSYWEPSKFYAQIVYPIIVLIDPNQNIQVCFVPIGGVTHGPNPPIWQTTLGSVTYSGDAAYINYGTVASWYASNNYGGVTSGAPNPCVVMDSNGNLQAVSDIRTANESGTTEPTWATTRGATTTDNAITWTCLGPGITQWSAPFNYSFAYHCVDGTVSTESAARLVAAGGIGIDGSFQLDITGPNSTDDQCDQIWIYRPAQGQATRVRVGVIPNPSIGSSATWSFRDVYTDQQLNAQISSNSAQSGNPPPDGIRPGCYALNRTWGFKDNIAYYSQGPNAQATSSNGNTQFAPLNNVPVAGTIYAMKPITVQDGGILVFTDNGIKIILWTYTSSGTPVFYATDYYNDASINGYNAVTQFNTTFFLMESNRKVSAIRAQYPFDPASGYTEVGFPIGDQFETVTTGGINATLYDPSTACVSWNNQDTKESALYVADGNVGWFRMSAVAPPESGYLWSPRRAIGGGTSAVQSIRVGIGQNRLLIGPASSGPIMMRSSEKTNYLDGSATYPSWDVKGANILCSTGEFTEVAHIATKSMAVGARPVISVLLNEIEPSTERPYNVLEITSTDPPLNRDNKSVYSNRYDLAQNGTEDTGDSILTRFDYGEQNVADELLDWGIYAATTDERSQSAAG